jgi:copper transport protein
VIGLHSLAGLDRVASRSWLAVTLALVVLIGLDDAGRVAAHAVLLRTVPSPRQTLPTAPGRVQLLFSEPIDPVFSTVRVVDASGRRVDADDAQVDTLDDHQLVVSLQPGLANGVYQVYWRSLSTIDVHPDQGVYSLFVGVPVPAGSGPPTTASVWNTATPGTTIGRWWFYLAASLFGGVLATWKLVFSGLLVGWNAEARPVLRRRAYRLIVLGGVLLVVGTLFTAVAQAAAAADVPLWSAVGRPLGDLLFRGRFAAIWWPRLALEVASLLLIALGGLEGLAAECALATLPAVLLTSSLTSHGAAVGAGAGSGIAIDWLHIVGATAWVGGLVSLLFLLPAVPGKAQARLMRPVLTRFFRFALVASGMVVLSGTLQAALEVGSWSGLVETAYGELVLVKIGLLVAMLVLAGFNELQSRRALAAEPTTADGPATGVGRSVRLELALAVIVLAVAALLSGTPPSRGSL